MSLVYWVVIVCVIILLMNLSLYLASTLGVKGYFVGSLLGVKSNIPDMVVGAVGALGLAALWGVVDGARFGVNRAVVSYA